MAHNILSILPHGIGEEVSFPLVRYVISCGQSKTTGEMLQEKVVVSYCVPANNGIFPRDSTVLDTAESKNDLELMN